MNDYVNLFKALSDETRLRIMVLLSEKELCVCQIEAALGLPQVRVSRHLTILRSMGLVKTRRDGLWIYYSLEKAKNKVEENLFRSFRGYLRREDFFKRDLVNMKRCIAKPLGDITELAKRN